MGVTIRIRVNGKLVRAFSCNSNTAPATVDKQFACESDTSLIPEVLLLLNIHDVAEGFIGGNLCSAFYFHLHLFPLSLPHPFLD